MAGTDRTPESRHVLFVCIGNSGRSQMSQAFFESAAAGNALSARSAGTRPAPEIDTTVSRVMAEIGYDLSGRRPKALTTELAEWADLIVTMGCGDACPVVPGTRYIDWNLSDPSGLPADDVRKLRDEIQRRVKDLVGELSGPLGSRSPDSAP